jgi:CRISPR-associated protein Cmr6
MIPAIRTQIHLQGLPENKSLLFNRLCPNIDDPRTKVRTAKDAALQGLLASYSSGTLPLYRQAVRRWKDFLAAQDDVLTFTMEVTSPLVVGKGDQNVHEFGITLQSPWATPVIPGSAVKGVLSTFAHTQGGGDWAKGALASFAGKFSLIMFGGQNEKNKLFAGALDFLDAWWLPGTGQESPFTGDIITAHNGTWYRAGTEHAPDNWPDGMDNPVPNPFAVVKQGENFLFAIRGTQSWRELAKDLLIQAATEHGFGAKTGVGYGRMGYIPSADEIIASMPAMSDPELAQLFQKEKGNPSLKDAFAAEAVRRPYAPELQGLFARHQPAVCMLNDLQNQQPLTWRNVRDLHDRYRTALGEIGISPEAQEVQTIFRICQPLAPQNWEQSWFNAFAPTACQLLAGKTADEIDGLLRNYAQTCPPLADFKEAIQQHPTLDDDDKVLLLEDFFPESQA